MPPSLSSAASSSSPSIDLTGNRHSARIVPTGSLEFILRPSCISSASPLVTEMLAPEPICRLAISLRAGWIAVNGREVLEPVYVGDPKIQEVRSAARGQERCHLRRGRLDRRRGGPCLRSRRGERPSRWSNRGEPRGGGREDPLRGRSGGDGASRCARREGGR